MRRGPPAQVTTTTPSLVFLLPGFDRCLFGGGLPLPLDGTPLLPELAGCWIVPDAITLVGTATTGLPVDLALPLPGSAVGVSLYFQALALDLANFDTSMSNGFAVGVGQ